MIKQMKIQMANSRAPPLQQFNDKTIAAESKATEQEAQI